MQTHRHFLGFHGTSPGFAWPVAWHIEMRDSGVFTLFRNDTMDSPPTPVFLGSTPHELAAYCARHDIAAHDVYLELRSLDRDFAEGFLAAVAG